MPTSSRLIGDLAFETACDAHRRSVSWLKCLLARPRWIIQNHAVVTGVGVALHFPDAIAELDLLGDITLIARRGESPANLPAAGQVAEDSAEPQSSDATRGVEVDGQEAVALVLVDGCIQLN